MFSGHSYPTRLLAIMYDQSGRNGSVKSKMATSSKRELLISQLIHKIQTNEPMFFEVHINIKICSIELK